jgi:hypothetical protein
LTRKYVRLGPCYVFYLISDADRLDRLYFVQISRFHLPHWYQKDMDVLDAVKKILALEQTRRDWEGLLAILRECWSWYRVVINVITAYQEFFIENELYCPPLDAMTLGRMATVRWLHRHSTLIVGLGLTFCYPPQANESIRRINNAEVQRTRAFLKAAKQLDLLYGEDQYIVNSDRNSWPRPRPRVEISTGYVLKIRSSPAAAQDLTVEASLGAGATSRVFVFVVMSRSVCVQPATLTAVSHYTTFAG